MATEHLKMASIRQELKRKKNKGSFAGGSNLLYILLNNVRTTCKAIIEALPADSFRAHAQSFKLNNNQQPLFNARAWRSDCSFILITNKFLEFMSLFRHHLSTFLYSTNFLHRVLQCQDTEP